MNKFIVSIGVFAAVLMFTACGGDSGNNSATQNNLEQGAQELRSKEVKAEAGMPLGKKLYKKRLCASCHGMDGTQGLSGAKNLQTSQMEDAAIRDIIKNGKGVMPPVPNLSQKEMDALVDFVKDLRK